MALKQGKKPKSKVVEERTPKHVMIRLSYRDFLKLQDISTVAGQMKEDVDARKFVNKAISEFSDDLNADKFLGLVAGLPAKERTLEKFYSQPPRAAPARMYFTDPEKCTKEVSELYEASKKWTKDKGLRYDQVKETCPTDVRVMFYAYVRGKKLAEDGKPDITIDKFLKKIAPKSLAGVKNIKRNDGSFIWKICTEIRGKPIPKTKPKKLDEESDKKSPKKTKKVVEESDESSEEYEESSDEEPPRKSKKVVDTESESDEVSEDEEPKKTKSKRR
jgi:hypothetical protein